MVYEKAPREKFLRKQVGQRIPTPLTFEDILPAIEVSLRRYGEMESHATRLDADWKKYLLDNNINHQDYPK